MRQTRQAHLVPAWIILVCLPAFGADPVTNTHGSAVAKPAEVSRSSLLVGLLEQEPLLRHEGLLPAIDEVSMTASAFEQSLVNPVAEPLGMEQNLALRTRDLVAMLAANPELMESLAQEAERAAARQPPASKAIYEDYKKIVEFFGNEQKKLVGRGTDRFNALRGIVEDVRAAAARAPDSPLGRYLASVSERFNFSGIHDVRTLQERLNQGMDGTLLARDRNIALPAVAAAAPAERSAHRDTYPLRLMRQEELVHFIRTRTPVGRFGVPSTGQWGAEYEAFLNSEAADGSRLEMKSDAGAALHHMKPITTAHLPPGMWRPEYEEMLRNEEVDDVDFFPTSEREIRQLTEEQGFHLATRWVRWITDLRFPDGSIKSPDELVREKRSRSRWTYLKKLEESRNIEELDLTAKLGIERLTSAAVNEWFPILSAMIDSMPGGVVTTSRETIISDRMRGGWGLFFRNQIGRMLGGNILQEHPNLNMLVYHLGASMDPKVIEVARKNYPEIEAFNLDRYDPGTRLFLEGISLAYRLGYPIFSEGEDFYARGFYREARLWFKKFGNGDMYPSEVEPPVLRKFLNPTKFFLEQEEKSGEHEGLVYPSILRDSPLWKVAVEAVNRGHIGVPVGELMGGLFNLIAVPAGDLMQMNHYYVSEGFRDLFKQRTPKSMPLVSRPLHTLGRSAGHPDPDPVK